MLGPGSDADHASHFHVDLAKRRPVRCSASNGAAFRAH
ncbi:MAG: extensin family protein [Pseudomonadota bacterium]